MPISAEDCVDGNNLPNCDDEDVELEGTPLQEYVKNLCLNNDDEMDSALNGIFRKQNFMSRFWHGTSLKEFFTLQWNLFLVKLQNIFPIPQDLLANLCHYYYMKYGEELLQSRVVLEEDLDYLCLRAPQQFLVLAKEQHQKSTFASNKHPLRWLIILTITVTLLACCLSPLISTWICAVLALLITFIIAFSLWLQILLLLCKHKHEMNIRRLQSFLQSSEKLSGLARRSIRLIQEIEVVLRGYSLLATRALLAYKLPDDDDVSYYICNVPITEVGICFVQVGEDLDGCMETISNLRCPEDCSLSMLKSINELVTRQRSELLTRFFLILAASTQHSQVDVSHSNFMETISLLTQTTSENVQMIQDCYEAHRNVELNRDVDANQSRERGNVTSSLHINLRTLQVHLRAALYKSMELDDVHLDDVTLCCDCIGDVQKQMDAAKDCYARCLDDLEVDQPTAPPVSTSPPPFQPPEQLLDDVVNKSSDDDMEDKVFEAVNNGETEEQRTRLNDNVPDEPVRVHSASVIRELQSVLVYATSEHQRDMRKRQLFPSYRAKSSSDKTTADETSADKAPGYGSSPLGIDAASSTNHVEESGHVVHDGNQIETDVSLVFSQSLPSDQRAPASTILLREEDSINHQLQFYKKPSLPGRLPSRKHRADLPLANPSQYKLDNIHSGLTSELGRSELDGSNTEPAWTHGLGIGFSNNLAMQAVDLARKRAITLTPSSGIGSVTYGSDSSDEG